MKLFILLSTFLFPSPDKEILAYREMLYQSFYNAETAGIYYAKTNTIGQGSPAVLKGYKAMSAFIMCKHTYNPFNKLSYFYKGKKELDAVITANPGNSELIFLRFTTQCNAPSFLGYNTNIKTDKSVLLNYVHSPASDDDKDLKTKIITFMLQSKHFTEAEKKQVRAIQNLN